MRKALFVGFVVLVVSVTLIGGAGAASCDVPSGYATLTGALADPTCSVIRLAPGTYIGPFPDIDRQVDIVGAGAGLTVLQGNGSQSVVVVNTGGAVRLYDVTITGGGGSLGGGGIRKHNSGTLTVSRSLIHNNVIGNVGGGGIRNTAGTTVILDSTIRDNAASTSTGGGVHNGAATLVIERSTISGNYSAFGGAGFANNITGADATFTNVTISGNESDGSGGGFLSAGDTTASMTNVTITGNIADLGGGAGSNGGGVYNDGTLKLKNTIIAGNFDGSNASHHPDCDGQVQRQGWVLIGSQTSACSFAPGDDSTGYLTSVSPGLGTLADNGGPTLTHALLPNSIAVNSGGGCGAVDQRAFPRTGGPCDRGAYELLLCLKAPVTHIGTSGSDVLEGTSANEVFLALDGNDVVRGRGGKDRICGGGGRDRLSGGGGKDRLAGGGGRDRLSGGGGADRLNGGSKHDVCAGGDGDDAYSRCEETPS